MRQAGAVLAASASVLAFASGASAQNHDAVTPSGWRVQPAGSEFGVSPLVAGFQGPLAGALTPDGTRLLTTSSGAARVDSIDLFDLAGRRRTDAVPYDADAGKAAFYGLVVAPDGKRAWASGGGQDVVHVLSLDGGHVSETGQIAVPHFPAGLAYGHTPKGDRLYVAENLSSPASGAAGNPPGHEVTVIDPATDQVTGTIDLGVTGAPLGVAFDREGDKALVTDWLARSVSVIDTSTEQPVATIQLSPPDQPLQADHPGAIAANPQRDEAYVANASSDTVSVIDTRTNALAGTIDVSLVPRGPKGAIPDGLSVAPDGRRLYVAEAGENAVAVVDLDRRETIGFIPAAWYPADVDVTPDGAQLVVTNTNDSGAGPNPCGPTSPRQGECPRDPARDEASRDSIDPQYTGSMIKGSVQVVDVPDDDELAALTKQVRRNNQAAERARRKPKGAAQIKHVVYVIKENRTYDQVFGDLPKGDGDPSLNLFKDDSAPNHRALARQFVTLDAFFADAEVSADGHNWATQANATDYVDKTWPINYSPRPRSSQRAYDFEDVPYTQQLGTEPLASDPSIPRSPAAQTVGYLWDDAFAQGVSFRDYGEFTQIPGDCTGDGNVSHTTHLDDSRVPSPVVDHRFPGYNLACSDHTQREPEWAREFDGYVTNGNLPALEIVRFPNDHTRGTTPGAATPQAYMADNDLALGRLVEKVSHSPYWSSTLILVTEDDAQNGPDHVDAHRTVALAISPWTQTGKVDHTHYSTSSMLATTEDLLGLPPMSIVDARAARLWKPFAGKPDATPYSARTPAVTPYGDSGAPTNSATAAMARTARTWNFRAADATPELALNRAIWKSIRGRHARMPAPRHTRIIGSTPNDG
jgi:YVTN family beta-propeller protein